MGMGLTRYISGVLALINNYRLRRDDGQPAYIDFSYSLFVSRQRTIVHHVSPNVFMYAARRRLVYQVLSCFLWKLRACSEEEWPFKIYVVQTMS